MGGGGAAGNTYLPQICTGLSSPSHPITRCPSTALPEQLPSHLLPSHPRKSGEGEGAGGPLVHYGATTTVGYVPNQASPQRWRPEQSCASHSNLRDLADRPSEYVRLHPGSEGGEFDLALAISGSCSPYLALLQTA